MTPNKMLVSDWFNKNTKKENKKERKAYIQIIHTKFFSCYKTVKLKLVRYLSEQSH